MATGSIAGTVKGISGIVTAVSASGAVRTLKAGDSVYAGETIQTAQGANAHIDFTRGGFATLGAGQALPLDGAVLSQAAEAAKPQADAPQQSAAPAVDVENLQQQVAEAIARGEDPAALMEAAAAGPGGAGGGGGQEGGQFVIVDQNAARGNVTPGFDTGTFSNEFQRQEEYIGQNLTGEESPEITPPPRSAAHHRSAGHEQRGRRAQHGL